MSESNKRDLYSLLRESLFGGGAETAKERDRMVRLLEINRMMVSERQPKKLLAMILDAVIEMTAAERGFLILKGETGRGEVEVARNLDKEAIRSPEFKFSQTVAQRVMEQGQTVLADSATDDPNFGKAASVMGMQLRSSLCAPLRLRGETIGCVSVEPRF